MHLSQRAEKLLLDETMPYYQNRKLRIAPEADNLQALFAEAEILAGGQGQGQPRMVELIDTIMSIPSCLQDQQSKIQVVNKWIEEHKNKEISEETKDDISDEEKTGETESEKLLLDEDESSVQLKDEDDTENATEVPSSVKRRKSSRKLNKRSLKKLKEVENLLSGPERELEPEHRPRLLYKGSSRLQFSNKHKLIVTPLVWEISQVFQPKSSAKVRVHCTQFNNSPSNFPFPPNIRFSAVFVFMKNLTT